MSKHQFALHLRGLPWSATLEQISEFMEGRAQPEDCYICLNRDGRASGEAYVGFANMDDFQFGKGKHRQNMGSRYIEVYESSVQDMEREMGVQGGHDSYGYGGGDGYGDGGDGGGAYESDWCVKMRGLPFQASEHDIRDFFQGKINS